jgi:acetylornithine aminotransferase
VFDIVSDPAFLQGVVAKGEKLKESLRSATKGNSHVKEIRGVGLLVGVELDSMAGPVVDK